MSTLSPTLSLSGQVYSLRWDLAALFWLSESRWAAALERIAGEASPFSALVAVLWAALPASAHRQLAQGTEGDTPSHMIEILSEEGMDIGQFRELLDAVFTSATEGKKNATSSSLSPASSSD